jgi:predicted alpha/beta superfamily hydrolase
MHPPTTPVPGRGSFSAQPRMLTFELYTLHDDLRPVFLTGSFNSWATRDDRFRMEKVREGHYRYTFPQSPEGIDGLEYKYIKGGWESEELGLDGFPPENRSLDAASGKVIDLVPQWKQHAGWYDPAFYPDIQVISHRFNLPQLKRRRRISILLPWNYHLSDRRYPVLYLQDGQNLFEEDAPFGTWGVDKQLAALAQRGRGDFIVVAIDHGGKERIREFNPYDSKRWGDGLGAEYARFLGETLKPYIDAKYRTLPEREHTGIGGSSMGGLISIYAGIVCPQVFSKFMVFSPSLWVSPKIYFEPLQFASYPSTKIYLYAGAQEGAAMVTNAQRFKEFVEHRSGFNKSHIQFRLEIDPNGRHNESRWGQEFPRAAEWLF